MGFFSRVFSFGSFLAHSPVPVTFREEQRTVEQLRLLFSEYLTFLHQRLAQLTAFCVEMNTCAFVDQNFLVGLSQVASLDAVDLSRIPPNSLLTLTDFHQLVADDVLVDAHKEVLLAHLVLSDAAFQEITTLEKSLRARVVALDDFCVRLASLEEDYALAQRLFCEAHALLVAQDSSLFSLYRLVNRKISSRVPRPDWFSSRCRLEYWLNQDASRKLRTFILWMEQHVAAQVA